MRIKLYSDADQELAQIVEQILKKNPFIEKDMGRLVSSITVVLKRNMQPRYLEELVQLNSTPESARLSLLREVETLSQGMDAAAMRSLEATVRKLRGQVENTIPPKKLGDPM